MTAVNNLNEHSSTGVVNNPTSPLVDRDANTVMVFLVNSTNSPNPNMFDNFVPLLLFSNQTVDRVYFFP